MRIQGDAQRGVLLGCSFGLAYYFLLATPTYFKVSVGIYITALFLSRQRWWPYLIVGAMAAVFAGRVDKLGHAPYTYTWLAAVSCLPPLLSAGAVAIVRKFWPVESVRCLRDALKLLAGSAVASIAAGCGGLLALLTLTFDLSSIKTNFEAVFIAYTLGVYIATISIAPAAFALNALWAESKGKKNQFAAIRSRASSFVSFVSARLIFWVIPIVIASHLNRIEELNWLLRLMMLLLVMEPLLHNRKGWLLTTIMVPVVNIGLALTQGADYRDPNLYLLMELSSFLSSIALVWSIYFTSEAAETDAMRRSADRARVVAKKRTDLTDLERNRLDPLLEQIDNIMHAAEQQLKRPNIDLQQSAKIWWYTASSVRSQIKALKASTTSPFLEEHGVRIGVASGPVALMISDIGATLHVALPRECDDLSPSMQGTLYRAIHQASLQLMALGHTDQLWIRARLAAVDGNLRVVVRISATHRPSRSFENGVTSGQLENTLSELRRVAAAYEGDCRHRVIAARHIVTMTLIDDEAICASPSKKRPG